MEAVCNTGLQNQAVLLRIGHSHFPASLCAILFIIPSVDAHSCIFGYSSKKVFISSDKNADLVSELQRHREEAADTCY